MGNFAQLTHQLSLLLALCSKWLLKCERLVQKKKKMRDLNARVKAVLEQQRAMAARLDEDVNERRAQEVWEASIDRSLSGGSPPQPARRAEGAATQKERRRQRKHGELLMRVRVDLGGGRTETIMFHRGDDVRAVALDFVRAHGLGDRYAPVVGEHIERNLTYWTLLAEGRDDGKPKAPAEA